MVKLFVISFEGMNYDILNRLIDNHMLENFKKLNNDGYIGEIKGSRIPYEASGLVSAFSGLEDYEHGVLSYWQAHNYDYLPKTYDSNYIKYMMIWNQEELKGYKQVIINIFGTHPPYPVNGCLISYAMNRTLRYSYPDTLIKSFASQGLPYLQDMGAFFVGQDKNKFAKDVLKVEGIRYEVCKKIIESEIDILYVNFTCIDRVCHFFMNELKDDTIAPDDKIVYYMYKQCDMYLGGIMKYVYENNADLILFSSVGFNHLKKFVEINPYLKEKKLLTWSDNPRIPDWSKTIAFEAVQGTHGININRKFIYEQGIVNEHEYDDISNEVIFYLKKMKNPYNGNQMFKDVVLGREYYKNHPYAPDIITLPFDSDYLPYGDSYWSDRVMRHSQTGWHDINTVWGGIGPNISGKVKKESNNTLTQIAPTINHILSNTIKNGFNKSSLVK